MEAEPWTTTTSSIQSNKHRDLGFMGLEADVEEVEETVEEEEYYACPFFEEDLDLIWLCCHIDEEHDQFDSKGGVCPICATRVGVDMVAHITLQHANIIKMQRKRSSHKSGSHSTLSLLRKELREGNLLSLLGGSSFVTSSTNAAHDPLLSSFILPMAEKLFNGQSQSSSDATPSQRGSDVNTIERNVQPSPPLSVKDMEERTKRSEFVHRLLMSAMFEDK